MKCLMKRVERERYLTVYVSGVVVSDMCLLARTKLSKTCRMEREGDTMASAWSLEATVSLFRAYNCKLHLRNQPAQHHYSLSQPRAGPGYDMSESGMAFNMDGFIIRESGISKVPDNFAKPMGRSNMSKDLLRAFLATFIGDYCKEKHCNSSTHAYTNRRP